MHRFAFAELTLDLSHSPNSHLCGRRFQISQRPSYQFLLTCQVSKLGSVRMGLLSPRPLVFLLMFKALLLHFPGVCVYALTHATACMQRSEVNLKESVLLTVGFLGLAAGAFTH